MIARELSSAVCKLTQFNIDVYLFNSPSAPVPLTTLQVNLMSPCEEYPSLEMNEACKK